MSIERQPTFSINELSPSRIDEMNRRNVPTPTPLSEAQASRTAMSAALAIAAADETIKPCVRQPEFYQAPAPNKEMSKSEKKLAQLQERIAVTLCRRCVFRTECLDEGLDQEYPDMIWGGYTPSELRKMSRYRVKSSRVHY